MNRKNKITIGVLIILIIAMIIVFRFALYRKAIDKEITIMIDAGHGGKDPGTIGVTGVYEKDINLDVARILERKLWEKGYRVMMIRDNDEYIDVYERANMTNEEDIDLFLSLHCNAIENKPEMNGIQVLYYPDDNLHNEKLANIMMKNIIFATDAADRNIVPRKDLIVLNNIKTKTLLIEMGFLTNKNECSKLEKVLYQEEMVKGITRAVDSYYNEGLINKR